VQNEEYPFENRAILVNDKPLTIRGLSFRTLIYLFLLLKCFYHH